MANYNFKQTKKTIDLYEYEVTIDYRVFQDELQKSMVKLAKNVKVAGFRPGKAPTSIVQSKVSNDALNDAVNTILPETTYEIIVSEKLNPITAPSYEIKKVSENEGVIYTFSLTNYPEIELGNFSKIKVEKKKAEVTDKDAEMVIRNIVKSSLPKEKWETKKSKDQSPKSKEGTKRTKKVQKDDEVDTEFPLTDQLIKELNYENEKTVESMKETVKKKLLEIKQETIDNEYVNEIVKEATKLSKIELPKILVHNEVHNMEHNFEDRVKELGIELEEYLKSQDTTIEKKREEWEANAKERISQDLVLITLATKEKVTPTEEEVQKEIDSISDPALKKEYDNVNGRNYVRTVMTKQKGAVKLLELVEGKTE